MRRLKKKNEDREMTPAQQEHLRLASAALRPTAPEQADAIDALAQREAE